MRCTVREKNIRTNRRARSVKPEPDHNHHHHLHHQQLLHHHHHHHVNSTCTNNNGNERATLSNSITESGLWPMNYHMGLIDPARIPNPCSSGVDDSGWDYCSEEKLEEILLKNLELLYNEAIAKLVGLGYDEEVALKAMLRNGHCYGGMDVLTNILHNSLAYLNSGNNVGTEESEPVFADLRQLEEYSLAGMVCLLQQVKPHLSKGAAMWCLLMSELHVGRASVMDIPVLPSPSGGTCGSGNNGDGGMVSSNVEGAGNGPVGISPGLCRFHGDMGFGNGGSSEFPVNGFFSCASEMALQREIECPKRFNLSPSMKSLLKRNVAAFAAGFRANSKKLQNHSLAFAGSLSAQDSSGVSGVGVEGHIGQGEDPENPKNQDAVNSVLSKFRNLNLEENAEHGSLDQKDEMILSLIHQIKDLERQVKDRKEWAHQKAMQAARKLSHDLTELKMLRMEREETQRLKKGKQTLEDTTMKKLQDMENALRKASAQVDRANAGVRKLETENAEIRAEMEASKLSASESVTTCLEVAKREKKYLKRLLAWEKQKTKFQEDITTAKREFLDEQERLVHMKAGHGEVDVKLRQEQKAKEVALALVEEERRRKEEAEANQKRRIETLRLKTDIDQQRHKDDVRRLEQEKSRLNASLDAAEVRNQTDSTGNSGDMKTTQGNNTIERQLHESIAPDEASDKKSSYDRECIICKNDEASVLFLPCAHEVVCANCNESYWKKGRATCPCCRVPIEQRIRVFGTSSS